MGLWTDMNKWSLSDTLAKDSSFAANMILNSINHIARVSKSKSLSVHINSFYASSHLSGSEKTEQPTNWTRAYFKTLINVDRVPCWRTMKIGTMKVVVVSKRTRKPRKRMYFDNSSVSATSFVSSLFWQWMSIEALMQNSVCFWKKNCFCYIIASRLARMTESLQQDRACLPWRCWQQQNIV